MVLAGVVGARLTWVLTHLDQIDSPLDVIAVWEGGLQFAGGFLAAIAVGLPTFLKWNRLQRWQLLDGFAVAVLVGAGFGRLGCLSVGEHFGSESSFFLATRFEGSFGNVPLGEQVREGTLGPNGPAVVEGLAFHNPSLYEGISLFVMFAILWWVLRRRLTPGTTGGIFLLAYAVSRFGFDALRVNDDRFAGLTGAQWMCVAMVPIGIYVLTRVRPDLARRLSAGEVGGTPVAETTTTVSASGRPVSTTKRRRPSAGGRPSDVRSPASTTVVSDTPAAEGDDEAVRADKADEGSVEGSVEGDPVDHRPSTDP
jgi:phosphatidylglycerol:prolipoprotein diacylglycerol transferase